MSAPLLLALALACGLASAQEAVEGPRLPTFLEGPSAAYPPAAQAAGATAVVTLHLDLDPAGAVVGARALPPPPGAVEGPFAGAFAESALSAARGLRFTPALNERGEAVPCTIEYQITFRLDAVPAPPAEEQPLAGDEGVPPAEGALGREAGAIDAELVVEGERRPPEVTERALGAGDIRLMPGTGGDVVRAIQALPGVARSPFGAGQLLVRGTGATNSSFNLDGQPLPDVFHFGGLVTVVAPEVLDEAVFLPGNFGVRYGRVLGGVVDLRTDVTLPAQSQGSASVDLLQAAFFEEKRVNDRWALSLSARRSYIDSVLDPILARVGESNMRVPRFGDVVARALRVGEGGEVLDLVFLTSFDRSSWDLPDEEDPGAYRHSNYESRFTRLSARHLRSLSGGWQLEVAAMGGPESKEAQFLEIQEAWDRGARYSLRTEVVKEVPPGRQLGWRVGVEALAYTEALFYGIHGVSGFYAFKGGEAAEETVLAPSVYVEQTERLGPLDLKAGLRLDHTLMVDTWSATTLDPRLSAELHLGPSTRVHASGGRYSQPPTVRQVVPLAQGNRHLAPEEALNLSLGLEQDWADQVHLELTGYAGWLDQLIVGKEDHFSFIPAPPPNGELDTGEYANEGSGRVRGLEALGRYTGERTTAWLSLTLSRSSRTGREGQEELFTYDQPFVGTLAGSRALPRRVTVGLRGRYGSGNPYSLVANRIYDFDRQGYAPLYGEADTARMPAWWSFDARIDKSWLLRRCVLTAYVDIMNTTNRENVELVTWSADYTSQTPIYGLPILPIFGLRGEW